MEFLNPIEERGWDEALASVPGASFFHTAAWARVLAECYGYRPCHAAMRNGSRLDGLLPLMEVNSWMTGRRGVSLPFSDECPPIGTGPDTARALVAAAQEYGAGRTWQYLELRGGARAAPEMKPSRSYFGHTLDLSIGEERLLAGLTGPARTAIRKAAREGVQVRLGREPDLLRGFFRLNCLTRREHGLPPQSWTFFRKIQEHVLDAGLGVVVLAESRGRPAAGAVFFHLGPNVLYKYGASDRRRQHLRTNNLVLWEAIRWYAARGASTLSLGRTDRGHAGLRRFKLGWGASEHGIEYFKYDFRRRAFVEDRDRVTGWHNRVFRRMPIPVARAAGALLYPHMA